MCGVSIDADGDKIVAIRGDESDPFSQGHVCPKAFALKDLHEDPDRLRAPMRRTGDTWKQVSWESALDEAAEGIHRVQQTHGRNAVGVYSGNPMAHSLPALMFGPIFLRAIRSRNRFSATSVDQLPHMFASYRMFGHQLLLPIPDVDRCDYMLMLGANPLASNGSIMTAPGIRKRLRGVVERGALVVIDPRRSETAKIASQHHFIRPGTDAFLLLALVREAIALGPKVGRLAPDTDGLSDLQDLVAEFTPERASAATGIDTQAIKEMAAKLHGTERAVVYGRMGTCTQEFGGLCAWLLNALNIVCGNFDRPGGSMFTTPAVDLLQAAAGLGVPPGGFARWRSRVRGLPEFGGELPVSALREEIETEGEGQIRGMVTLAGNPVLSTPDGAKLDRALGSLEFMVSVDIYLNETTRHANLILPPVSPLERPHYDLVFAALGVRNTAKYAPPMFEPATINGTKGKHDGEVLNGLTVRLMSLRHGPLHRKTLEARATGKMGVERLLDIGLRAGPHGKGVLGYKPAALGPMGKLSLDVLRDNPHGLDLGPLMPTMPERLPSKHPRIQLSPACYAEDLDRLRAHEHGTDETPGLRLIGRRHLRSNNSWMHNAPSLMSGRERCSLMMHPKDADARGFALGDRVRVRTRVGEVEAPLELTDDIMPGVVSLPHGFGHSKKGIRLETASANAGVSANDLTDPEFLDGLTGNAALNGVPVEVISLG